MKIIIIVAYEVNISDSVVDVFLCISLAEVNIRSYVDHLIIYTDPFGRNELLGLRRPIENNLRRKPGFDYRVVNNNIVLLQQADADVVSCSALRQPTEEDRTACFAVRVLIDIFAHVHHRTLDADLVLLYQSLGGLGVLQADLRRKASEDIRHVQHSEAKFAHLLNQLLGGDFRR